MSLPQFETEGVNPHIKSTVHIKSYDDQRFSK